MKLKRDWKTKFYMAVVRTASGRAREINTYQTNRKAAEQMVAEAKLEQLENAALIGKLTNDAISFIQTDGKTTLATAIHEWVEWLRIRNRETTAHEYQLTVRSWLHGVNLEKDSPRIVEAKHIHAWINDTKWAAKKSTRHTNLAAIKSFCQFCTVENYMTKDPSLRVVVSSDKLTHAQKAPVTHLTFTEEEVQKLAVAFEPGKFWHVAVALGRYAGLRIGDVCRLEWESFKTPGVLMVWTHKRNKPVHVPIHPLLEQALKSLETHDNAFVFPAQQRLISDVRKRSHLSTTFTRACRRVGIHGKSFHDLRRTFCTVQAQNGASTQEIGKLVGHSNTETTEGYIQR